MAKDGLDDFYLLHRFNPSKEDAVTYFLPHLLAGSPLPYDADRLIRHAEVYTREPRDLAAEYAPVPSAVSTGDRFFFTTCKHKSGSDARIARVAGAGTWAVQKTEDVYHEGVKVGEAKHLSFKKGKVSTGWVMKEYRCLLPEAVVADGEKVLCKIHLAPKASAAARQESAAYKLREERAEPPFPVPETVTASAHAQKRPAPVATADLSSCKKMRMAAPVPTDAEEYEDCPVLFTPAAPVSLPTASTDAPEADDDTSGLSFSWEELFGEQQQEQTPPIEAEDIEEFDIIDLAASVDLESETQEEQTPPIEAENNTQQLVFDEGIQQLDIDQLAAPTVDVQSHWDEEEAEPKGCGMVQREEESQRIEAENNVAQLVAYIDWGLSEELQSLLADHDEEQAKLYKKCNLHDPSLEGHNQFFSFGAVN